MEYVILISDEVYFRIGNINIGIETLHKNKLISDIVDIKKNKITKDKELHTITIKKSIHQEEITI